MWLRYPENKPENDIVALVAHEKGWMSNEHAIYRATDGVWTHYDPNYRSTLLLDITHYLPIPIAPRIPYVKSDL
jgi:hypothetical protein